MKKLVGEIQLRPINVPLCNVHALLVPEQHHQGVAGDAFEDVIGDLGSRDASALDHENASPGLLGDLSEAVQHDGSVIAILAGLKQG